LVLRDLYSGQNTNSDTNGGDPDQLKWNQPVAAAVRPASADQLLAALAPGGQLEILSSTKGTVQQRVALGATAVPPVIAVSANQSEVLWAGGVSFAFSPTPSLQWHRTTAAPVTVTVAPTFGQPDLQTAVVAVPGASGVQVLNGTTGKVAHSYQIPAPPSGSQIYPVGTGFLVAGPHTAVYQ
jgi:hypothetical protein